MGTTMALAPGLSRKLKKVMESRTDSPDLLSSLNTLSTFYTDNTPHARKTLRSVIEKRYLSINHDFLFASNAVQRALDIVEEEVNALAACCDRIEKTLETCHASTRDEVNATERLKQELDITNQRQNIVASFLGDYQLSQDEIIALTSEHLSEDFFRALSHVKLIHSNCRILLRTHHQRAGLELMNMMAGYQEAAYERLCRWVQAECLNLNDVDNPEVGHILKTAILCLKERAVLFKYCIEEIANMRHNALFRRFISALTRGGPGGMPRPIEVHAHDPLRYVGDMLGWLHQALASEKELIFVLLDTSYSVDDESTTQQGSVEAEIESGKEKSEITLVLDRIFEGVCRPFKIRVDQVLKSQPNLIILYKLANTLDFYSYTISDLLTRETVLCDTVWALRDLTEKTFFNVLKSRGEKLLRYTPLVSIDLSPLPAIQEETSLLIEIIKSYDSIMIPVSGKKPDFDPVLSALLDPLIQMCTNAAEALKSKLYSKQNILRPDSSETLKSFSALGLSAASSSSSSSHPQKEETSSTVFLINSLCAIQHPLKPHHVAAEYIEKVGMMIDDHMRTLVTTQVDAILAKCMLLDKVDLLRNKSGVGPTLSELEETSPSAISECLKAFFGIVLSGDICPAEFDRLQVPTLRADASVRVVRSLAHFYELVYRAVMDPHNRYPEPEALARHPPDQVRTILGI